MKLTKRKGFNFFRSYFDVYNELNDEDKVAFIDALLDRQFLGQKPESLKGMAKFAYISQTNSIDSQVDGYNAKAKQLERPPLGVIEPPYVGGGNGGKEPPAAQEKGKEQEKGKVKGKVKDIKERKAEFKNSLHQFLEEFGSKILNEFYNYWTEHGERDRKMRFEKEKSFNKKLRLDKWLKNSIEWEKEKSSAKKEKPIMLSDKMKQDYGIN